MRGEDASGQKTGQGVVETELAHQRGCQRRVVRVIRGVSEGNDATADDGSVLRFVREGGSSRDHRRWRILQSAHGRPRREGALSWNTVMVSEIIFSLGIYNLAALKLRLILHWQQRCAPRCFAVPICRL